MNSQKIDKAFEGTNFGPEQNNESILIDTLLKYTCGYQSGFQATRICMDLGFLSSEKRLTKDGKKFLYDRVSKKIELPEDKKLVILDGVYFNVQEIRYSDTNCFYVISMNSIDEISTFKEILNQLV